MEPCEGDDARGEEAMDVDGSSSSAKVVDILRGFLGVQQRRAEAYAKLHRYFYFLSLSCSLPPSFSSSSL